jgi:GcrA cell cycle regulator
MPPTPTSPNVWADERTVAQLKADWVAGLSASMIARRLGGGLTRSAILGKIHRLGLPGRHTTSHTSRVTMRKRRQGKVSRADHVAAERLRVARAQNVFETLEPA